MRNNKTSRIIAIFFLSLVHFGCTHPIEINGNGVVTDNRRDLVCNYIDSPCDISVVSAYQAQYYAQPYRGWQLDNLQNCQIPRGSNSCEFIVDAGTVKANWFKTAAPLIANFSQSDSDQDGVVDLIDIRPNDAQCTGQGSHAYSSCAFDGLRENNDSIRVLNTASGLQYIMIPGASEILRYRPDTQEFSAPIRPDTYLHGGIKDAHYSETLGGVAFLGNNRSVYFVADDSVDATPVKLFEITDPEFWINAFGVLGDVFVFYGENSVERVYSATGTLLSSSSAEGIDHQEYVWDAASRTAFSIGSSNADGQFYLRRVVVDGNGEFSSALQAPMGTQSQASWMQLSPNGSRLLLSNGSVYNTTDLSLIFSVPNTVGPITWLSNGELLSVHGNGQWPQAFSLLRSGTDGNPLERMSLDGLPNAIVAGATEATLFFNANYIDGMLSYEANNDRDADGIDNPDDAFPDDVAASLDSDRDGYPDSWNTGYDAADSTSNLSLDNYAEDHLCYLAEHGTAGSCNHAARIEPYYALQVLKDANGVVYLLDAQRSLLHRWSSDTEQYLATLSLSSSTPIEFDTAPTSIAHHADSAQIFVGYANGQVRSFFTASPTNLIEHSRIAGGVRALTAANNKLFVSVSSGNQVLSIDISSGEVLDTIGSDSYYSPASLVWNQASETLYGGNSGAQIRKISVDNLGQFAGAGWSTNNFVIPHYPGYKVSMDGSHLFSGQGRLYQADDSAIVRSFEETPIVGGWAGNALVTAYVVGATNVVTQWDADFQTPRFQQQLNFTPAYLLGEFGSVIAIGAAGQQYQFTKLAINDADSDGMPAWWEIQNGLNDNDAFDADLDGDLDGLSNLQEYQWDTDVNSIDTDDDGLSDGDEVNNHQSDPRQTDSDGDGLSDGEEVNLYASSPTSIDSDNDRMKDGWEVLNGLNPADASDAVLDSDSDGYSNFEESTLGSNPFLAGHPEIDPWTRPGGNVANNAYFPLSLDESTFTEAWVLHNSEYGSSYPSEMVAAQRSVYRVINDNYSQEFERYVEIIDADTGETDRLYPVGPTTGQLQSHVYHSGQLLFSGYSNDENYNYSKELHSFDLQSGQARILNSTSANDYGDSTNLLIVGNELVDVNRSGAINYDLENDQVLWTKSHETQIARSIADGNSVYIYQQNNSNEFSLEKIDRSTGDVQAALSLASQEYYYGTAALSLSKTGTLLLYGQNTLRAIDAMQLQPLWERNIGQSTQLVIGQGKVFTVIHGVLFVLDEFSGETLWVWSAPNNRQLLGSVLATRSHVFVSSEDQTFAISIDSGEAVWSYPAGGALSYTEGKVLINYYDSIFAIDVSQDIDGDGMPSWWERQFELDDSLAADAGTDADTDGLSNFEEYLAGINPRLSDSDSDGVSDFDEIRNYNTRPEYSDSDQDGLSDSDELTVYFTNPNKVDSDGDSFTDSAELQEHNTDPNDENSVPAGTIVSMHESFEAASLPTGWTSSASLWTVASFQASTGEQSLLSGTGTGPFKSRLFFEGLFSAGTLAFDVKGIESHQAGTLTVLVDGIEMLNIQLGQQWLRYSVAIPTSGNHRIEWRYDNFIYGEATAGFHFAQLDEVTFNAVTN